METKLSSILALPGSVERTAALAWWLQSLYPSEAKRPVLVGGAAMELYAGGAYLTADLDFVGTIPPSVEAELRKSGFGQLGSYWLHNEESVSIIFRGEELKVGEKADEQPFGDYDVLIVSSEDLLVDRLAVWRHQESPTHGVQAYLLYYIEHAAMDIGHLHNRAAQEDVQPALDSITRLFFQSKGGLPKAEFLGAWASREMGHYS